MIDKSELESALRNLPLPKGVIFPVGPNKLGELSSIFPGRDENGDIFTSQWVSVTVRGTWGIWIIGCDGTKETLENLISKIKEAIAILA
jgi:hypothetical protein